LLSGSRIDIDCIQCHVWILSSDALRRWHRSTDEIKTVWVIPCIIPSNFIDLSDRSRERSETRLHPEDRRHGMISRPVQPGTRTIVSMHDIELSGCIDRGIARIDDQ
jgi:hypothetical protein